MSTTIKPEISKKSRYWIEKHRYYELKHFCLQYPVWQKEYADALSSLSANDISSESSKNGEVSKPTEKAAEKRLFYGKRIDMVKKTAKKIDPIIGEYILKGVTEGLSYDKLNALSEIPCCKDTYYLLYRKFFKLLSKKRK